MKNSFDAEKKDGIGAVLLFLRFLAPPLLERAFGPVPPGSGVEELLLNAAKEVPGEADNPPVIQGASHGEGPLQHRLLGFE